MNILNAKLFEVFVHAGKLNYYSVCKMKIDMYKSYSV